MDFISVEEMRRVEENSEALGVSKLVLMENAGAELTRILRSKLGNLTGKKIVIMAGTGNNGGDGLVAARHLARDRAEVTILVIGGFEKVKTHEASVNLQIIRKMTKTVKVVPITNTQDLKKYEEVVMKADVLLDAIFGTGIHGGIREPPLSAIKLMNSSKAFKVAVDVPSGLDPEDGAISDEVVKADVTVTFHRAKNGLREKENLTGSIVVVPIGVPPEAEQL